MFSVQNVQITLIILKSRDPLLISMIFIFSSCREKAHDNKEFNREN